MIYKKEILLGHGGEHLESPSDDLCEFQPSLLYNREFQDS